MPIRRPFRRVLVRLWLGVLAAMALLSAERAVADDGVLVLRNGNVLKGSVTQSGDYYRVDSEGASLQIPAEQVQMACRTLQEAYELRQDRVGSSVDAHLELARWCLRHDLLDQAAREILDARTTDPRHPSLTALDLQLRHRLEAKSSRAANHDHEGAQRAVETALAGEAELVPPSHLDPSIETQTQFVRSIQPMLIQNCAAGGCHQPGARQQLQLDRWALEGGGNPTLIRRNLVSVLTQINKDDPPSSPLIQRARRAHGVGSWRTSTPLATYQAALLLQWANQAAGVEPELPPESSADELEMSGEASIPTGEYQPVSSAKSSAAAATSFTPRDSFDPEIFNRRYAARRNGGADQRLPTIPKAASMPAPAAATEAAPAE